MKAPISILAIAALAVASAANASTTFHPSNDEAGTTVHVVAGTLTKSEREALDRAEAPAADSNWVYRGEEAGWDLAPHSYEFRGGRLEHTDRIPHDAPLPGIDTNADSALYRYLERG